MFSDYNFLYIYFSNFCQLFVSTKFKSLLTFLVLVSTNIWRRRLSRLNNNVIVQVSRAQNKFGNRWDVIL